MTRLHEYDVSSVIPKNLLLLFLSVLILLFLITWILPYLVIIFISIGVSLVFAWLLDPLVIRLESMGVGRVSATMIVLLLFSALVLMGNIRLLPVVSEQVTDLLSSIPDKDSYQFVTAMERTIPFPIAHEWIEWIGRQLNAVISFLMTQSVRMVPDSSSLFFLLVAIPVMTFFFLKDGDQIKKYLLQFVSNRCLEMVLNVFDKLNRQWMQLLRSQLIVLLILSSTSAAAFFLLQIPCYLIIGIMVGFAYLVPYYGILLAGVIAITAAFLTTNSLSSIVGIVVILATMKLIYRVILFPIIKPLEMPLHPLLILILILAGMFIGGVLGMLLVLPLSLFMRVATKQIKWGLKQYRLFDRRSI